MASPLYSQISTGQPLGNTRTSVSLKLDWNETGGFDGTVSRVDPTTGVVLETITGSGNVQSRQVSVEFPGHGNFRGRLSKDRSVITGRLLFWEAPQARVVIRRFKLYAYAPTTGTVGLTITLVLGSVASGDIDLMPGTTNTNLAIEVPAP